MSQQCTNLRGVFHAEFSWRNQIGMIVSKKPRIATVNGMPISGLVESCKERALQCADRWTPVVKLYMSMARVICYEGKRAQSIWKEYCAKVYGKKGTR